MPPSEGLMAQLIDSLRCLPGVGPKTARRMAFHLLQRDRQGGRLLAQTLLQAVDRINQCRVCRTLTELEVCPLCQDLRRDRTVLCVVESPADIGLVERATGFNGQYFVLHGRLSPLDGIGPDELGFAQLEALLAQAAVAEVILAMNATVESEVTCACIGEMAGRHGVKASRLAHGVPMGGELEFIDSGTLAHAFNGRKAL